MPTVRPGASRSTGGGSGSGYSAAASSVTTSAYSVSSPRRPSSSYREPVAAAAAVAQTADLVGVAEEIVNGLMPLLDCLNDVASGILLQPGSPQFFILEKAATNIPAQLKSLLSASEAVINERRASRRASLSRRTSISLEDPPAWIAAAATGPAAVTAPSAASIDPNRDQQEDWFLSRGRTTAPAAAAAPVYAAPAPAPAPAPERRASSRRNSYIDPSRDQPEDWFATLQRQRNGGPVSEPRQPEPVYTAPAPEPEQPMVAYSNPAFAADIDPEQARLKAEKERQRRLKEERAKNYAKPPPNFRLMEAEAEAAVGKAPMSAKQRRRSSIHEAMSIAPELQDLPPNAVPAGVQLTGLAWKDAMILKKAQEDYKAEKAAQDEIAKERARWEGMPAWKRALLQKREQKAWDAGAADREAAERERQRMDKFNAMPAWKQQLLMRK